MFELVVQSGKQQGSRLMLPLNKSILVGRDEGCGLTLASSLVSRQHCELKHIATGILVTDLGSQNGTYINDVAATTPTLLQPGDTLRIGACLFEVQPHQPPVKTLQPTHSAAATSSKTAEATARRSRPGRRISDNDIADWLADGDTSTDLPTTPGDTTIIHRQPGTAANPTQSAAPTTPVAQPKSRVVRSVEDEAADIIRRHWAKVRGE